MFSGSNTHGTLEHATTSAASGSYRRFQPIAVRPLPKTPPFVTTPHRFFMSSGKRTTACPTFVIAPIVRTYASPGCSVATFAISSSAASSHAGGSPLSSGARSPCVTAVPGTTSRSARGML